ncbi:MAG TPA: sigma-70 family RNA polymerase sigma factor [Saprospiraceae bacterium]|nr:sigma-70 family RNA polymerase sigma factor [Saprospiraceae bacterium]HND89079.1 sigma-70 family RNA polymerase sigma factor [Saprospiraceae bacterium]
MQAEQYFVERLRSGDEAAYAELYDRYGRNLYTVIAGVVHEPSDAKHILQDAFVKIWQNIHRYDPAKGRLYTWLLTLVRRLALDFVRSQYFRERQMIRPVENAVHVQSPAAEMLLLDHIGLDEVLTNLEPHLRQVLLLQYYMGYTQQEVADETGLPLGTVKSRTRAALSQMRAQLSDT